MITEKQFDYDTIVVHGGPFHADDLLCATMAKMINPDIKVIRESNPKVIEGYKDQENILICDIGRGEYDHHQEDALTKEDGTKYCAAGHLYKDFWYLLPFNENIRKEMFEPMLDSIDRHDNYGNYDPIGEILGSFITTWKEPLSQMNDNFFIAQSHLDNLFKTMMEEPSKEYNELVNNLLNKYEISTNPQELALINHFANKNPEAFENFINDTLEHQKALDLSQAEANKETRKAYDASENKLIVTLPKYMPWQETLLETEALYCIYPSARGGYNLQCVPTHDNNYTGMRLQIPETATEAKGNIFRHNAGFICAFETAEQAYEYANSVIEQTLDQAKINGFATYADMYIGKEKCGKLLYEQEFRTALESYIKNERIQDIDSLKKLYGELEQYALKNPSLYDLIKDNTIEVLLDTAYSLSVPESDAEKFDAFTEFLTDFLDDYLKDYENDIDYDEF